MIYRRLRKTEEQDAAERQLAERTLQEAADALGISPNLPIHFFVEGHYGDPEARLFLHDSMHLLGLTRYDEIYIRAELSEKELRRTLAHEARHIYQLRRWDVWGPRSAEQRERDAILFELERDQDDEVTTEIDECLELISSLHERQQEKKAESDDWRRKFAPFLKARAEAASARAGGRPGIEFFSAPAVFTVSR
jgi:hypothetical protein